jgi:RNA polymerase sigma factor (sigma-70 family)
MDASDIELLRAYAETGNEECFGRLVKRHVSLVYSTALRNVGGDEHLAQDVAQMVFAHLAHSAKSLLKQRALAGWLYRDAFFSSSKLVRSERRRLEREKQANMSTQNVSADQTQTNELLPILDEIISRLRPKDLEVLVLRFFEGMELRTAAGLLGISEKAFQKRVERAVHQLRAVLASKDISVGSGAVTSALMAGGFVAAPPNLALVIAASSMTSVAAVKSTTFLNLFANLAMTKLKIAGSALLVVAITAPLLVQQNALNKLREENRRLRMQSPDSSVQKNADTPFSEAADPSEIERLRAEHRELLRLRGEVGVSRSLIEELKAKLDQAKRTERRVHDQRQDGAGLYHPAEIWANVGYEEPQSAAITFFWAVRNGDQAGYSGAFGREMPDLEDAWSDAFKSVKGSFLSKPKPQPNGDVRVSVTHETTDGDIVNSLLTYRQENNQWVIRSMAGFPTGILDASSGSENYGSPVLQSSSN